MRLSAPIAFVDGRRQVVVLGQDGDRRSLTGADDLLWASWEAPVSDDVHSWPTWSPDGRRLAAFRIARSGRDNRVWVTDVDGVQGAEVASMAERVPIYLQWSLEGDSIAVLSQASEDLVLQVADPHAVRKDAEILRGSPLFFSWVEGERIAAFVGEGEPARPRLAVVTPGRGRHELVGVPSNFCAPMRTSHGVAYVAQVRGHVAVLISSLDGSHVRELESVDGLVALMRSPDGRCLARAISHDGTGTPYRSLELLDPDTALANDITDRPHTAFFWLPDGSGLILADTSHDDVVTWFRVGLDGDEQELAKLVPSRDSRLYLRFFEQYGLSHPVVSPTGDALVLCGTSPSDPEGASRVHLVPLDGSPVEELGEGLFASFGPAGSPSAR